MDGEIDFKELLLETQAEEATATQDLYELANVVDSEKLFIVLFAHLCLALAETANELTHSNSPAKLELLAFHLFPSFGAAGKADPGALDVIRGLKSVDALFKSIQRVEMYQSIIQSQQLDPERRPLASLLRSVSLDARVVRGSAYPEQTAKEIRGCLGPFDTWFQERIGIAPTRAADLIWSIVKTTEENATLRLSDLEFAQWLREEFAAARRNQRRRQASEEQRKLLSRFRSASEAWYFGYSARLAEIAPSCLPVSRQSINLDPLPSEREWDALCELIGCSSETRGRMTNPMEMAAKPLFVLTDKRLLCGVPAHALDQVRNAFESVAATDASFFERYKRRRADWHQAEVVRCLKRIFPASQVFESLSYPDPDKPPGSTAELDAAVWWNPFLIVVEAKSNQFRLESQLGDIGRLRTDIKKNVAEAFEQAQRAARYVKLVEEARFVERGTGRGLVIRKTEVRRIFQMTVSLRLLANIATFLASARPLNLFPDRQYPWAISLADLDTVVDYCEAPDVFLHYFEKRLAIQSQSTEIIGDELRLFGAYLKTRLLPSIFLDDEGRPLDGVVFGDSHLRFDEAMEYRRGERRRAPDIRLEVPSAIAAVLAECRNRNNDANARLIAHSLLSLSNETLKVIDQMLVRTREQWPRSGRFGRAVYADENIVICVVATADHSSWLLQEQAKRVVIVEKYRRRADVALCFGVDLRDSIKPFSRGCLGGWRLAI